jgi:type VI secretion system protein ImpJ
MRNLSSVVWSEGMFLGPHHFQAQSRYFQDSLHFAASALWPNFAGFTALKLDAEALKNAAVSLVEARGIFGDGLPFQIPEVDRMPAPLGIEECFPPLRESVEIMLGVPVYVADGANFAADSAQDSEGARFAVETRTLADENTGRDEKAVAIGRKTIRLLLDAEASDKLVTLPVARVKRDGAGHFIYDEHFVPPLLSVGASPYLTAMLRRLVGALEQTAAAVAKPKDLGTPTASGFSAQGIANAWFLHAVNSSLVPLSHLAFTCRAHPEQVYVELTRLAGALCTFGLDSHPSNLPDYDHARPAECFRALDHHVRTHLELIVPSNCVPIPLERVAAYFWQGKIADQRTLSRSRWILGLNAKIGEAEIITKTPQLVKVCSREFLPKLVSRALPGLKLTHLQAPPPALSPKLETQYFAVDKAGPCWEHMVLTRELAIYIPGELPDPEVELSVILD